MDGPQVVYVDGAWDMFHCAHIALLRNAKALGDLLIVGVHADAVRESPFGCCISIHAIHDTWHNPLISFVLR